jgi:hypothetical protein
VHRIIADSPAAAMSTDVSRIAPEVRRRRTFAIISHPQMSL